MLNFMGNRCSFLWPLEISPRKGIGVVECLVRRGRSSDGVVSVGGCRLILHFTVLLERFYAGLSYVGGMFVDLVVEEKRCMYIEE